MTITIDRLISAAIVAVVAVAALVYYPAESPSLSLLLAAMICLPGLVLIWFSEPLGEVGCFARGLAHNSPPGLIAAIGWVFLIGYPALLAYVNR